MNLKDIKELGLKPGDKVDIRSSNGEMSSVSVHPFDILYGDVLAYYPEANILTGTDVDPRSKTPSFKSTGVQIEPSRS